MYKQKYDHEDLENLSEELAFEELHRLIEAGQPNFPTDPISLQDIVALTLNHVPAKYVTSFVEKLNPREQHVAELNAIRARVKVELQKAIKIVAKHPHN